MNVAMIYGEKKHRSRDGALPRGINSLSLRRQNRRSPRQSNNAQGEVLEPGNRPLEKLFNNITLSYDLMNKLLTLGMDRRWRRRTAETLAGYKPLRILDLCTGTGDLAYALALRLGDNARVTGLDFSPAMLERAEEKRKNKGVNPEFILGDASALPFKTKSFDAVATSFAFRNLTYHNPLKDAFLSEVRRVLKPGGIFVIVESSQPKSKTIRFFRNLYVEIMVGKIVGGLTGHKQAYRYLADSIKRYHTPGEIQEILRSAGFPSVRYTPFLFGAVGIHVAGTTDSSG